MRSQALRRENVKLTVRGRPKPTVAEAPAASTEHAEVALRGRAVFYETLEQRLRGGILECRTRVQSQKVARIFAASLAVALLPSVARAGEPAPAPFAPPITLVLPPQPVVPTGAVPPPPKLQLSGDLPPDYATTRYEPAGLPLLGGNSDIGFQFGAAATLTRFDHNAKPYAWNMDLVLDTSVKDSGTGLQFAQQNYVWNWDIPDLAGGKLRLNPEIYYQRTVDQGYFGLGNASSPTAPPNSSPRYFQYLDSELRARQLARIALGRGYELVFIGTFRAEAPTAYPGTQLSKDASSTNANGAPLLWGVGPGPRSSELGIAMLGSGFIYDSRDNEIFPRSGAFHQVGVRVVQGLPYQADVRYGAFGANFSWMMPLWNRTVVFATRLAVDLEAGNVPFYDLFTGGPFETYDIPGGPSGVRGVPSGRYLGRVKALGNAELRSLPLGFRLLDQSFHMGGDVFFDTGRIWLDYTFNSPLDGTGLGLKYGIGGGLYAEWGQAALFRIDVAYSPDQVAENPRFPLGLYVEEGVMF